MYAGKLCAALDRQHPRDLFDVMLLQKAEGIDRALFDVFLVYLAFFSAAYIGSFRLTVAVQPLVPPLY
jgi:nucleotidyltransferase AbiEii toxin of type IV toxin-antitoxin system